jgi:xanthine dehydrogenase molybdopterin-binding subunit B
MASATCLQIEGGFVQGMGWLCLEEMIWGDKV